MARRMFSDQITDSDSFLDLPVSSQNYYFHLIGKADDDGFVKNPQSILRNVKASKDDYLLLIAKKLIIAFENGVIVIKHWRIHNLIRHDRYKPTVYQDQMAMLDMKENKAYTLKLIEEPHDLFSGIIEEERDGNQMATQDKLSKVKLIEVKEEKNIGESPVSNIKHKYGTLKNVLLTDEELEKLKSKFKDYQERVENLSMYMGSSGRSYQSHYLTILNWDRRDKNKEDKDGETAKSIKKHQYVPRRNRQSRKDETSNS